MTRLRTWSLVVLALSALGLAGCGGSSSSPTTTSSLSPSTTTALATITDPSPVGTFGVKPTVTVPPGAPPTQLESKDLIVGTGPAAKSGDNVTVQYVGVAYSSGKQFDASWDRNQPFQFTIGGNVIPGWNEGVVGMKVGGRRELIIPPNLAYGAQSPGPGVAANDTLVFVVDLLKIG
jgi:hypothetical protein